MKGWTGWGEWSGRATVGLYVGIKTGTVWTFCSALIHPFNRPSINSVAHPSVPPIPPQQFFFQRQNLSGVPPQISMTLESMRLASELMNSHFSNSILIPLPFWLQWRRNDLHRKYALRVEKKNMRRKSTKEGYRSPSRRPSLTPPTVWKKAKETQRAGCGQEDVERGRQSDKPEREEGKAGRQGERAAGREMRQGEKRRWFGSQLLLYDDLLPRHAVTNTHKQAFTVAGLQAQLQKSLIWPENVSQADIFTLQNTHKLPHYGGTTVCESLYHFSPCMHPVSFSLSVYLSVCHISISFALLFVLSPPCVLSRKESAMVKPREGSNFAGSALFLSISVVLYVCPESPTGKKKKKKRRWAEADWIPTRAHTHTARFLHIFHLRSRPKNRSRTFPSWFPARQDRQYALMKLVFKARD